ncbi:MAG: AhpC/TSA family protein [Opitutaceae bacterium]|nr:AhpC/TSA family protein [Opitutaceae bacterium]
MPLHSAFALLACLILVPLARAGLAPSPDQAKPLALGDRVPSVLVQSTAGESVDLAALAADQPTLLVFYRGSWCPFCNRHLAALAGIEEPLRALGWRIVAISPDDLAGLKVAAEKNRLAYRLFSDRAMHASAAFGLAFRMDAATVERYRAHQIDLAPVPGEPGAFWLPVPAAFLIDRQGVIRFVHADPDYKVRLSPEALLAAAQAAR